MRFGLVDELYQLSSFAIKNTQIIFTGKDTENSLIASVREYCDEYGFPDAISAGFPATIDKKRKKVISAPNIKGLNNLPVADILEQALGIPVFVNRDTNFLLLYDVYHYQLDELANIIGCYIGTGFGNAVLINGRILLGKNGAAAELGHIPMLGKSAVCGCGNVGCIEAYASGKHLSEIRESCFPDTHITDIFSKHSADEAIEQFIDQLSLPVATEINIFDPDHVIVGGGVIQMKDFPLKRFEERIRVHSRKPFPESNLDIIYSYPKQENGVIGAGIYAYKRLADGGYV